MTFECKICGKRWNDPRFESEGTFFTLCPPCGAKVLRELESGITAMEIKAIREKKGEKEK